MRFTRIFKSKSGFTLIEILIAVMLTGMITAFALAPVVVTVRRIVEIQNEYSDLSALSRTMNFIGRDLSSAMRLSPNVILIKEHESLGGNDDDVLIILSTAPVAQNLPAGSLVYKLEEGGVARNDIIPGLYRWIFPGKNPEDIDIESLNPEDGQIVLPDVKEFCVEVPGTSLKEDRRKDYKGELPPGLYIRISRHDKNDLNNSYKLNNEDEKPLDELESFIVFP